SKGGEVALEIAGFDQNLEHQSRAKKIGADDRAEWELRRAVAEADLVVLATPVLAMKDIMTDIAPLLKSGAVVTDTASTKADVMQWAKETLPTTVHFIGGHPMAGKAESIDGAEATLFTGATWCICPAVNANDESVRTVLGMVAALGSETFFVDPVEHDAFVAGISHLPFVVSASIMNALTADSAWKDMKTLTAGGFRDTTRLASGSPAMHRDIVLTNTASVQRWIASLIEQLEDFQSRLRADTEEERAAAIDEFFTNARDRRAEWAVQTSRESELLGSTPDAASEGLGDQMSRMFLGGFMRKKRISSTPPANGSVERR
ncbi:MAG: prephenate dehydrogenase, partial [Thermomicrobiales bacterium]